MSTSRSQRLQYPPSNYVLLFFLVVVGMLAHPFWRTGWQYLAQPYAPLFTVPLLAILVRIVLSSCAAAMIFVPLCQKLQTLKCDPWMVYFIAFQSGFAWQAAYAETLTCGL